MPNYSKSKLTPAFQRAQERLGQEPIEDAVLRLYDEYGTWKRVYVALGITKGDFYYGMGRLGITVETVLLRKGQTVQVVEETKP